jgi:hypothetical protein
MAEVAGNEGIHRLARSQLGDPTAAPELLFEGPNFPDENTTLVLDDVANPGVLYFRTYVVGTGNLTEIYAILEPDSLAPRVLGPLARIGRTADYGMAYDPTGPSLYVFETTSTFDGNFVRID